MNQRAFAGAYQSDVPETSLPLALVFPPSRKNKDPARVVQPGFVIPTLDAKGASRMGHQIGYL